MSTRRTRLPGRLLLRIYLVGLAQLLLISFAFNLARRYVAEEPRQRFFERNATYFVSEWARHLEQPEELQGALDRAGQQLRLRVTMRAADGRLLASSLSPPRGPLSAEKLRQLDQERVVETTPSHPTP